MAGEFLSVYHAKLHLENDAGDDHLVLGEVTYAVPTLSRRMEFAVKNPDWGEDESQLGNLKFSKRIMEAGMEFIRSMDIKIYKAPLGVNDEKLKDPWKKFDIKTCELVEHVENKDMLDYYQFGPVLINHFLAEVLKGIQPGKKFSMVSKS